MKQGDLVVLTKGAYEDFDIVLVCRALCDIDADAVKAEYLSTHIEQAERYHFNESAFVSWLMTKRMLEILNYTQWFLGGGSTGDFSVHSY